MNDLLYSVGLDISDLKTSARATKEQAEDIKRGFKGFKDVLEFGGVGIAVLGFFRSVINHAQELKGPLDENTAAVKRFGNSIDEAKTGTLSWGAQLLGFLNRAGEGWGMLIRASIDGTAAVREAALGQRAAEEAQVRAAELRAKHGAEFKKITEDLTALERERKKLALDGLTVQERTSVSAQAVREARAAEAASTGDMLEKRKLHLETEKAELELLKNYSALDKEAAEAKKLSDGEKQKAADQHIATMDKLLKLRFEALTTDQQIAAIEKENAGIVAKIAKAKKDGVDSSTMQVALLENQNELGKLRTEQAREKLAAEKEITEEIEEQVEEAERFEAVRVTHGRTDAELSDRELAEKIANLRRIIDQNNIDRAGGGWGDPFAAQAAMDLARAVAMQQERTRFRQSYATSGEQAFLQYSAFDEERLRQYIRPEDEARQVKQAKDIEDLAQRFAEYFPRK